MGSGPTPRQWLGIGGNLLLQNYIWAEYYGRGNLGAIRGAVQPIMLLFGGIGAPIAGYVRDVNRSMTRAQMRTGVSTSLNRRPRDLPYPQLETARGSARCSCRRVRWT